MILSTYMFGLVIFMQQNYILYVNRLFKIIIKQIIQISCNQWHTQDVLVLVAITPTSIDIVYLRALKARI